MINTNFFAQIMINTNLFNKIISILNSFHFINFFQKTNYKINNLKFYSTFKSIYYTSKGWKGYHFHYFNADLLNHINLFMNNLEPEIKYVVLLILKTNDNVWITLNKQIFIDSNTNQFYILSNLEQGINYHSIKYSISEGDLVIIKYREYTGPYLQINKGFKKIILNNHLRKIGDIKSQYLSNKYFPFGFKSEDFGTLLQTKFDQYNNKVYVYQYIKNITIERICILNDKFHNIIYENDVLLLEFVDTKKDGLWYRNLNNLVFVYNENGNLLKTESLIKTKFITNKNSDLTKDNKIITIDIETFIENNSFIPYTIGWFDGYDTHLYYLTDYIDHNDIIKTAFKDLSIKKYHNYSIYLHNFADRKN